jgi:16S rRNA (guanine966-N2)-methyltransferase
MHRGILERKNLFIAQIIGYYIIHPRQGQTMRKNRHKMPPDSAANTASSAAKTHSQTVGLRIVGGRFRGRKLLYSGDYRTRPMKDRLRESLFNLLGSDVEGTHAIDLFAGTGALGLEALSRGAANATFIEQHYPTADIIRQNILALDVQSQSEIVPGSVFTWFKRRPALGNKSWLVFCSPPYDFYLSRADEMMDLIRGLMQASPTKSVFFVEADQRFDFALLPDHTAWDIRCYPPAVLGVYRKQAAVDAE